MVAGLSSGWLLLLLHSFEMTSGEKECWLDSVTFHYRHACLPKIREDATVNIARDGGMMDHKGLNMTARTCSSGSEEERANHDKRKQNRFAVLIRM